MFISKIEINHPQTRNPYQFHRFLWQLFPGRTDEQRSFLFRVEKTSLFGKHLLLMQSKIEPREGIDCVRRLACKEVTFSLKENQRLRFYLVANPVKTIVDEKGRKDKSGDFKKCRVPLIREDERRNWLERKLADACKINNESFVIEPCEPLYFRKEKEYRSGKIQPIRFKGVLTVCQPQKLVEIITTGVGPAKSFGCGLFSIAGI